MNKKTITGVVIKEYKEFTEDIEIDELLKLHQRIIVKEVEAVITVEDGTVFSVGFSVMRDNNSFFMESPRRMVQKFLLDNFNFNLDIQE